jgi:hypothetical protein
MAASEQASAAIPPPGRRRSEQARVTFRNNADRSRNSIAFKPGTPLPPCQRSSAAGPETARNKHQRRSERVRNRSERDYARPLASLGAIPSLSPERSAARSGATVPLRRVVPRHR